MSFELRLLLFALLVSSPLVVVAIIERLRRMR